MTSGHASAKIAYLSQSDSISNDSVFSMATSL